MNVRLKASIVVMLTFLLTSVAINAYFYSVNASLQSQLDSIQQGIDSLQNQLEDLEKWISNLTEKIEKLEDRVNAIVNETIDSNISYSAYFTYTWPPENQTVVDGNLTLEIWITAYEGGNLTIIAKINDNDYYYGDYLGLVFIDSQQEAYGLFVDNMTLTGAILTEDGFIGFPIYSEEPGPQKVTFNLEAGYTFVVKFPWADQYGKVWNPTGFVKEGNILHICFGDEACPYPDKGVFIRFQL